MSLFIGGPWDGQHREVPKAFSRLTCPVRRYPNGLQFTAYNEMPVLSRVTNVQYNKLNICGVEICAEEGLSGHDVVRELIEGYIGAGVPKHDREAALLLRKARALLLTGFAVHPVSPGACQYIQWGPGGARRCFGPEGHSGHHEYPA